MAEIGGHMLHGVDHVAVVGSPGDVIEMKTDGRVYMWGRTVDDGWAWLISQVDAWAKKENVEWIDGS